MIGGFFDDKYILTTPKTPRHWTDRLFNDEYVVELYQVMQGGSVTFNNYNTKEFIKKQRHFMSSLCYLRLFHSGFIKNIIATKLFNMEE